MRVFLRKYWPIVGVVPLALAALGVGLAAVWIDREPPDWSRIEDGLLIGGQVRRPPPGVTAVLNLSESEDGWRTEVYRWEPIRDGEPVPSLDWLRRQVAFIESNRNEGRTVFVHCRNGVSRSGLVGAAYLTARHGWSRDEALAFLRTRRPGIRPNPSFLCLLGEWEDALRPADPAGPVDRSADR